MEFYIQDVRTIFPHTPLMAVISGKWPYFTLRYPQGEGVKGRWAQVKLTRKSTIPLKGEEVSEGIKVLKEIELPNTEYKFVVRSWLTDLILPKFVENCRQTNSYGNINWIANQLYLTHPSLAIKTPFNELCKIIEDYLRSKYIILDGRVLWNPTSPVVEVPWKKDGGLGMGEDPVDVVTVHTLKVHGVEVAWCEDEETMKAIAAAVRKTVKIMKDVSK